MTYLGITLETPDAGQVGAGGDTSEGEITARIVNDNAENGREQAPGPLTWMNSARLVADPEEDSIALYVSIDDPRGALAFTIRRVPGEGQHAGKLIINVPYPGAGMQHVPVKIIHEGALVIVDDNGNPWDFADAELFAEDVEDLTGEQCVAILERVSIQCYAHEGKATLREAVRVNLEDGTLDLDDVKAVPNG